MLIGTVFQDSPGQGQDEIDSPLWYHKSCAWPGPTGFCVGHLLMVAQLSEVCPCLCPPFRQLGYSPVLFLTAGRKKHSVQKQAEAGSIRTSLRLRNQWQWWGVGVALYLPAVWLQGYYFSLFPISFSLFMFFFV